MEVVPEGRRALDAAARRFGIELHYDRFDFASCDYYVKHGAMLADDWKDRVGGHDAIFYGAVGWPATCPSTRAAHPVTSAAAPGPRSLDG